MKIGILTKCLTMYNFKYIYIYICIYTHVLPWKLTSTSSIARSLCDFAQWMLLPTVPARLCHGVGTEGRAQHIQSYPSRHPWSLTQGSLPKCQIQVWRESPASVFCGGVGLLFWCSHQDFRCKAACFFVNSSVPAQHLGNMKQPTLTLHPWLDQQKHRIGTGSGSWLSWWQNNTSKHNFMTRGVGHLALCPVQHANRIKNLQEEEGQPNAEWDPSVMFVELCKNQLTKCSRQRNSSKSKTLQPWNPKNPATLQPSNPETFKTTTL